MVICYSKNRNKQITRVPSNLKPTTCEYVHLVTHYHSQSFDKDGSHTPQPVVAENHDTCKPDGSYFFTEPELWAIKVLHGRNGIFYLFAPVTLTLTRWPSHVCLTRIPLRYTGCANMNFIRQGFQKLSSERHTDRQTRLKLYTTRLRGWSIMSLIKPKLAQATTALLRVSIKQKCLVYSSEWWAICLLTADHGKSF